MQLLYGNDGINYRTISKSKKITPNIEKTLLDNYLKYDFITNNENYTNIKNEPEALTYFTSNFNNALDNPAVIVSISKRMTNYATPSYYYHAYIQETDDSFFQEQFFEIFQYQFIKDIDCLKYHDDLIDDYHFNHQSIIHNYLSDEQLITILSIFMDNENSGKKTKIIVDRLGDQYNQRAKEILMSIYYYLPYELRKRHGFISYSKDDRNIGARISFILFNKDELRNRDESYIDLEHLKPLKVNQKYIQYATYLVKELNDQQRKEHFSKLSHLTYNGRLRINDCVTYYSNLSRWKNGKQEELLEEWIDYVDKASISKGPLYEMMIEIISQKVTNQYCDNYLFHLLDLYHEDLTHLSTQVIKTIRFFDIMHLTIDENRLINWYFHSLENKKKNLNVDEQANMYLQEIELLKNITIASTQFEDIKQEIISSLTPIASHLSEAKQANIDQESEMIGKQFALHNHDSYEEMITFIHSIHLNYEDNQEILKSNIEEWIDEHNKNQLDINDIGQLMNFIKETKEYISADKYNQISHHLSHMIELMKYSINDKRDAFDSYMALLSAYSHHLIENETSITVILNNKELNIEARVVRDLLEFIFIGDNDISHIDRELFIALLENDLLDESHFETLISLDAQPIYIRKIIDYYYVNHHKLSGHYLYQVVKKYQSHMLVNLGKYYSENSNEELIIFCELCGIKKKKSIFKKK